MRLDFEIGALKFMYIGADGDGDKALELFMKMTDQLGKVLPPEIVQALVAADPEVVNAMKDSVIRKFAKKFEEEIINPIATAAKDAKPAAVKAVKPARKFLPKRNG
jgi:hypothetical protein